MDGQFKLWICTKFIFQPLVQTAKEHEELSTSLVRRERGRHLQMYCIFHPEYETSETFDRRTPHPPPRCQTGCKTTAAAAAPERPAKPPFPHPLPPLPSRPRLGTVTTSGFPSPRPTPCRRRCQPATPAKTKSTLPSLGPLPLFHP